MRYACRMLTDEVLDRTYVVSRQEYLRVRVARARAGGEVFAFFQEAQSSAGSSLRTHLAVVATSYHREMAIKRHWGWGTPSRVILCTVTQGSRGERAHSYEEALMTYQSLRYQIFGWRTVPLEGLAVSMELRRQLHGTRRGDRQ